MTDNQLKSLDEYSRFVAALLERFTIEHSTVTVWSVSKYTGIAEGEIFLPDDYRLRMREEIDFDEGIITSCGYEVYRGDDRLYWYDDFHHPNDSSLASTHPHHKHVPPDIKHSRKPAPTMSFSRLNLTELLREIEEMIHRG